MNAPEPAIVRTGHVRWFVCALLFAIVALNYTDRQVLSVLKPTLQQAYGWRDRKSTRLNSSHLVISYAVFCLKKKKTLFYDLMHPKAQIQRHARAPISKISVLQHSVVSLLIDDATRVPTAILGPPRVIVITSSV